MSQSWKGKPWANTCSAAAFKSNPRAGVAEPLLTSTIAQARSGNLPTLLELLGRPTGTKDL